MEYDEISRWLEEQKEEMIQRSKTSLHSIEGLKKHGESWYILVLKEDGNTVWQRM